MKTIEALLVTICWTIADVFTKFNSKSTWINSKCFANIQLKHVTIIDSIAVSENG